MPEAGVVGVGPRPWSGRRDSRWACLPGMGELAKSAGRYGCNASETRSFFTMSASEEKVEIHLDGAGAEHHVAAVLADLVHIGRHDP